MFDSTLTKKSKKLTPLSQEDLQKVIKYEVDAAIDFMDSNISSHRQTAENYYKGETRLPVVKGRSAVVVTKVKDTISSILPSIGRIFTQSDVICEFQSDDEEDEKICKQGTLFCNQIFHRYGGYEVLISAVTDALKARVGVVRVSLDKKEVGSHTLTQTLTQEQLDELSNEPDMVVTEVSSPVGKDDAGNDLFEAVMTRKSIRNKWEITCMPPEEFFVDDSATCLDNARLFGFRSNKRIYDVVAMGISMEDLHDASYDDSSMLDMEKFNRLGYEVDREDSNIDKTAKTILLCEFWMRIDADGDGLAELRHFITVGSKHKIIVDEAVDYHSISIFRSEVYPHVFFPTSLAEDVEQDQDAMTALLRSIIDNTALVNAPRTEVNENLVNLEDVKSNVIGGIVRVKQMGQINELATPFVAGQTLVVFEALNELTETRSGVTRLSQGVSPDALQSTSRIAANGIMQNSEARVEMIARNIGETGVKDMFMAILRTAMHELKSPQGVKTNTGYEEVDPSMWHDQLSVIPTVGMGNGRIDEKIAALGQVAEVQKQSIAQFGLSNPMAGYSQFRNTMKSLLRLSGVRNVNDYFPHVEEDVLKKMDQDMAQAKAQQGKQPDPSAGLVEAEKVKAQAAIQINDKKIAAQQQADAAKIGTQEQSDIRKLQTELGTKMAIETMKDDRERDAQAQDYAVAAYKVAMDAKTKADVAKEVAKKRDVNGSGS